MSAVLEKIDHWIFREYAPLTRGLPLYRIVIALWLLLFILPGNSAVSELPAFFFRPALGPAHLFTGFPPSGFSGDSITSRSWPPSAFSSAIGPEQPPSAWRR